MKKAILLTLLLAGCQTAGHQIAQDDTRCQSYGVAKGSPEYIACRSRLDQQRSDRQAAQGFGRSGGLVGALERGSNQ